MNDHKPTSMGTVIGFGFVILGILYLFASVNYHRTSLTATNRIPGILFIAIGTVVILIKAIRKGRE